MSSADNSKYNDVPDFLEVEENRVPLVIKRNRRSKRIYLRYNPAENLFSLTLPHRARLSDGVDFIHTKGDWILETLRQMPQKRALKPGTFIPILGSRCRIKLDEELRGVYALKDDLLILNGPREHLPRRVEDSLRKIVRQEISELVYAKAKQIGKRANRITLRDTRSRWGSCSSDRNLMFSWRLVFAPYEVLDYVVSHEVAHLKHMNHSARFWETVESICPEYHDWKDWLHLHGKELYRFTSE